MFVHQNKFLKQKTENVIFYIIQNKNSNLWLEWLVVDMMMMMLKDDDLNYVHY